MPFWMGRWTSATGRGAYTATLYRGQRPRDSSECRHYPNHASERKIKHGDIVDVFNERGRIRIVAKVTERIMPGVICVYQGAWYNPNEEGVDIGGCANTLTQDGYSPGGAFPLNSSLVELELFSKQESGGI